MLLILLPKIRKENKIANFFGFDSNQWKKETERGSATEYLIENIWLPNELLALNG